MQSRFVYMVLRPNLQILPFWVSLTESAVASFEMFVLFQPE